MSATNQHAATGKPEAKSFDEADPHGFAGGHEHAHVIISLATLRAVLAVLLVFTVLTVGLAQFEVWFQGYIGIELPRWVNVVIAMSIATVKSTLVLLYFMQLRYDNPINTIVFLFTLFAFALFLGFTTLDLGNRDTLYKNKSVEVNKGGLGLTRHTGGRDAGTGERATEMVVGSIVAHARKKYLDDLAAKLGDMELAKEEFAKQEAEAHENQHHGFDKVVTTSDFNHSRAKSGLTTDLYDAAAAGHDEHGGHGGGGAVEHAAEPKSEPKTEH